MSSALIIGDGPGGLSAALYLAKNGIQTTVFGQNETPMHYAMLYNYLGIPEMTGTEFQEVARQQITGFGANLVETQVKTRLKLSETRISRKCLNALERIRMHPKASKRIQKGPSRSEQGRKL